MLARRFQQAREDLMGRLQDVAPVSSHVQTAVEGFKSIVLSDPQFSTKLRSIIADLRPVLTDLLEDQVQQPVHQVVFHSLQLLTFIAPINRYLSRLGVYQSVVDESVIFPDHQYYYSITGKLLHRQELIAYDVTNYQRLADGQLNDYEKTAIAHYLQREVRRDKNPVLELLQHNMTRALLLLGLFATVSADSVYDSGFITQCLKVLFYMAVYSVAVHKLQIEYPRARDAMFTLLQKVRLQGDYWLHDILVDIGEANADQLARINFALEDGMLNYRQ
jgi:phytoene dehydrogenase-like protein